MRARDATALIFALVTGACMTQTDQYGRTVLTTPTLGQLLGVQPQPTAMAASPSGPTIGRTFRFAEQEGGKKTDLGLTSVAPGRWLVDLNTSLERPTCVGSVKAEAAEISPDDLVVTRDSDGHPCSLAIHLTTTGVSVAETGSQCMFDHGASCELPPGKSSCCTPIFAKNDEKRG